MPATIRHERLIAMMNPPTSAAWSVVSISGEASKTEVFYDAPEAEPDVLVVGEDVFYDALPLAVSAPKPACSSEDASLAVTVSGSAQGAKVKGAIASTCKITAAAVWGVLFSLVWVMKCVAGAVIGLARAVGWVVSSIVQPAVGACKIVAFLACNAWAALKGVVFVVTWPVVQVVRLAVGLLCAVACAAWALLRGVVSVVTWPVVQVAKLAVGLLCAVACAAWAALRGVVFMVTWPVVQVVKLVASLVRCVLFALLWALWTILKALTHLVLAVCRIVECVLTRLGPQCSQCNGPVDWDPWLAERGVAVPCAHRFPRHKVC
jgi:hypothetical protein